MALRSKSNLAPGTTLLDYASGAKIRAAFNDDMAAIRREHSRQRSIIRKRIERMEKAGETYSAFYRIYSDRETGIPSTKTVTDSQVLESLSMFAQGLGGGYVSTLSEVRERRKELQESIMEQAEEMGDTELAELLKKPLTPRQYGRIGRVMGMIRSTMGKYVGSDEVYQEAMKVVLKDDGKTSLLTLANKVMVNQWGAENITTEMLESMKDKYTARGTIRVSYKRAHGKRGK